MIKSFAGTKTGGWQRGIARESRRLFEHKRHEPVFKIKINIHNLKMIVAGRTADGKLVQKTQVCVAGMIQIRQRQQGNEQTFFV